MQDLCCCTALQHISAGHIPDKMQHAKRTATEKVRVPSTMQMQIDQTIGKADTQSPRRPVNKSYAREKPRQTHLFTKAKCRWTMVEFTGHPTASSSQMTGA